MSGANMNYTQQYNSSNVGKTFDGLNSNDSLLGGLTAGIGASFTTNLSKRMADAM